jgi:hypothetical protein
LEDADETVSFKARHVPLCWWHITMSSFSSGICCDIFTLCQSCIFIMEAARSINQSALVSSLSVEVLHLVVDCNTSHDIWSTLEIALASPSNLRIMQLHGSL